MYLYHLTKGSPFTEMAHFVFGGDPRRLLEMNSIFIEFGYNTFFNKISGTSLEQWIPSHLDVCRQLIYDALASGGIEEVEFDDGQVVDRRWILHHFQFESFRVFGFLDDFAMRSANRRNMYESDVQRAFNSGYLRSHGLKAQVVYTNWNRR